jgi:chorismate mutase
MASDNSMNAPAARIDALRKEIDSIDDALVAVLARRMTLAREIGIEKRAAGLKVYDAKREQQIRERLRDSAGLYGLDPGFVNGIYERIFQYAKEEEHHEIKQPY